MGMALYPRHGSQNCYEDPSVTVCGPFVDQRIYEVHPITCGDLLTAYVVFVAMCFAIVANLMAYTQTPFAYALEELLRVDDLGRDPSQSRTGIVDLFISDQDTPTKRIFLSWNSYVRQ